ncbi:DUF2163 domain-containing protein [Rhizobium sp. TRM95796]|uniref:DUF2163 domain-containing protein n=1 Tax=Rhizobium sp. TRM95796 TaxID=2979862 RepID=UPI0021E9845B|nr:DUF2163 domain-containing protein [Rhizobium sp. TRM95796]MCV3765607.1 DUF2163 domain-containing protein [Rhizobium sp. TRM95796]
MRTIPEGLAAHIAGEATTLANGWKVTRRDGVILGFTDHDHDLTSAGLTFAAASGFAAGGDESETGLAASSSETLGALSSDAITAEDIAAGRYDGATVDLYLVNWQAPAQHMRLRRYEIGEVARSESDFRAELRGLSHRLGQIQGRVYGHRCDAGFCDARCGLAASAFRHAGVVTSADRSSVTVEGLGGAAPARLAGGVMTVESGALAGLAVDVDGAQRRDGRMRLALWQPMAAPPEPGDAVSLLEGCDKRFETCRDRFGNALNFRGFPHMPGADFAYSYADGETEHDGRPLYD